MNIYKNLRFSWYLLLLADCPKILRNSVCFSNGAAADSCNRITEWVSCGSKGGCPWTWRFQVLLIDWMSKIVVTFVCSRERHQLKPCGRFSTQVLSTSSETIFWCLLSRGVQSELLGGEGGGGGGQGVDGRDPFDRKSWFEFLDISSSK